MSQHLLFAAIAGDDTGASNLAGMFADQGVRAVRPPREHCPAGALMRSPRNR